MCCPACRGDLDERTLDETLVWRCAGCGAAYPVVDGVPWLDEALALR